MWEALDLIVFCVGILGDFPLPCVGFTHSLKRGMLLPRCQWRVTDIF
jgi:hypothetical protein